MTVQYTMPWYKILSEASWERPGCMKYAWSQAVQMQFYVAFPLALALLRPRQPGLQSRVVHFSRLGPWP